MAAIQDTVAEVQAASDEGLVDVAGPDPSLHAPRVLPDSEVHTESRLDAAQSLGQMLQPKVAANSARLRRIVSDAPAGGACSRCAGRATTAATPAWPAADSRL